MERSGLPKRAIAAVDVERLEQVLVRRNPNLKHLSGEIQRLAEDLEPRVLSAHEVLFYEGELGESAYLLIHGIASVTHLDARHRRTLFAILGPGDMIGACPALPDPLRDRLRCDTFTQCEVGRIDRRRLFELLLGVPYERFEAVAGFACATESRRLSQMMLLSSLSVRDRLLEVMAELAERFGEPTGGGAIVDLPLTHADLADMVGASRPKVSHQLALLRRDGTLLYERGRMMVNRLPH